jgi:acyl carrier protein
VVSPAARGVELFGPDLGLDSVNRVELLTAIEKHFDIELAPELARALQRTIERFATPLSGRRNPPE